jgi:hypothetical protein
MSAHNQWNEQRKARLANQPSQSGNQGSESLHAANAVAANVIAASILDSLKSGASMRGVVSSYTPDSAISTTWISIELPGAGQWQVAVHCEKRYQPGQQVVLRCVPNPFNPRRYKFDIVE